jgi:flavodoxin
MKALVAYSSRTGNTKMVAEAIHGVMPADAMLAAVENAPDPADFDFIAVGFWVDKGMPDDLAKEFMAKISNKQVGLFGTLGAWPDSEHARECMAHAVKLMEDNGNTIKCQFICMGKVDPRLIEAMQKMPEAAARHAMTPERKARLEEAAKHPDAADLERAQMVFKGVCFA